MIPFLSGKAGSRLSRRCGRASGTEPGRACGQATRTCIRSVETISGSRQRRGVPEVRRRMGETRQLSPGIRVAQRPGRTVSEDRRRGAGVPRRRLPVLQDRAGHRVRGSGCPDRGTCSQAVRGSARSRPPVVTTWKSPTNTAGKSGDLSFVGQQSTSPSG